MANVWVIIVGYRNAAEIETCLNAVSKQSYSDWGVIICENGGTDTFTHLIKILCSEPPAQRDDSPRRIRTSHALEIYGRHPLFLLQADENLGYAGAINAAIAYLQQHRDWAYIWILNPDTEPHSDALAELLAKAEDAEYGIVGSRLIYKDTNLVQAYGGVWQQYNARGVSLGRDNPPNIVVNVGVIEQKIDYVLGACMLVTKMYIDTVGLMNDDYFLYCEEVDWCLRRGAFKLGYAHDSIVYHTQGTTIGSKGSADKRSRLAVYLDERNRLLIARRFYRNRFPLIAIITAIRLCRYAKNAAGQNFLVAVRGWWAGLRGKSGAPPGGRI